MCGCVFFWGGKGGGLARFRVWGLLDLKVWDFRVGGLGFQSSGRWGILGSDARFSLRFDLSRIWRSGHKQIRVQGRFRNSKPPEPSICCRSLLSVDL